ncbi:MAG: pyridoxal-phosphate dependent enzyme, partial [Gaiellales bacterium]
QPDGGALLLAKLEYLNPGGSVKDRIGLAMIEAAERDGLLRPGGVIVEPTSGNTGVALAMAAAQRGYRCIFVMPDKMSQEKISLLRALGADVVVCPTNVAPEDPSSYYVVSRRLTEETPGAFSPNQYANPANPAAHYASTGPEIWGQVGEQLDALVLGVGTGGTATGVGRYLKERKPSIEVVGADPEGSIYASEDVRPYLVEGVGEDFWPETFDAEVVDRWVRVSDRDAFDAARRLARREGILVGGSSGLALHAAARVASQLSPAKTVLVILPDGGRPYLSKVFDHDWLREHGMLEGPGLGARVAELLRAKRVEEPSVPSLVFATVDNTIGETIELLRQYGISQLPVLDGPASAPFALGRIAGSARERELLDHVFREGPDVLEQRVGDAMAPALAVVQTEQDVEGIYADLQAQPAVVVADRDTALGVLTRTDMLEFLAHRR